MNFRNRVKEEPEINLIPFIDVLLVMIIFLMLSTTYSKFTELKLTLPVANADAQRDYPNEIVIAVSSDGRYAVNKTPLGSSQVEALAAAITAVAKESQDPIIIISADASAAHQSVITVMEAARRVGLTKITFAAQSKAQSGTK